MAEQRVSGRSVDIDFGKDRKSHAEAQFAKPGNFIGRSWLLLAELVRRKTEDREAPIFVFPIEAFKRGILRSETALACGIGDEQNLPAKGRKLLLSSVEESG